MKAVAASLLAIFEKKVRLEVPLFQRQYVWNEEHQWEPLWEDISRKFVEYLDGRKDAPIHFLGAMVLDQKLIPITHVEKRQIIDGQQRLTTLQIFLSAFRDFCRAQSCEDLAEECDGFTLNRGMMPNPDVDKFKVWPTKLDRAHFTDVVVSGSRDDLLKKYPLKYRKYARRPEARPRIVEAYLFFYQCLSEVFVGSDGKPSIAASGTMAEQLEECFQALKNALQVVVIDLEQDDDAQVIFETLNARGEQLLPADLLRNFIFLRAARQGEPQESLYTEYWEPFDDEFWRVSVKQGRLFRPRSDLFMQHFLSSRQTVDIPITHLFVEYKFWIEKQKPFATIREELATLARQREHFRRIVAPAENDFIYPIAQFFDAFDVRTVYPLLLALLDSDLDSGSWREIATILQSYVMRRAVCGLTTKNYNRVFLNVTKALRRDGMTVSNLRKHLAEQSGDSVEWPSDEAFANAWNTQPAYNFMDNSKLVYILLRLNETYAVNKMEGITVTGPLTIEHILPQQWQEHWPLQDGTKGLSVEELWNAEPSDARTVATRNRDALLQTLGNLTLITQALNSAASNGCWESKKAELLNSLLPINNPLQTLQVWDESEIARRSGEMFKKAVNLWPRPARTDTES